MNRCRQRPLWARLLYVLATVAVSSLETRWTASAQSRPLDAWPFGGGPPRAPGHRPTTGGSAVYDPRQRSHQQAGDQIRSPGRYPIDHRRDPRVTERPAAVGRRPAAAAAAARYDPRLETFVTELPGGSLLFDVAEVWPEAVSRPTSVKRRRIITNFDDVGEEKGEWSEWSPNSTCSRTCGGGVTFRQRSCLSDSCAGPTRVYSSCNEDVACPEDEDGNDAFLLKQCQRMNSIPYDDGKFYSWIPRRRHDRNPCELNCSPKGHDLELKSRQNVIDGTRCYHVGFDQCVEGQCMPAGCDGLLGSKKRIDKCLVCGGEGKDCNTTHHTDTQMQMPGYGYRPVYVIPANATSVMIRELQPSTNYISLRDLEGTTFLNKDYEIDYSKAFDAAGAKWHYTRNQQYMNGREFLRTEGPTNATLVVVLLVQEMNRGYEVEYSLKQIPGEPRQRTGEFQWELGEWEPCYDPCGETDTQRAVRCASIISGQEASDPDECDLSKKPPHTKACPTDNCQAEWYTGKWENCNNTCGNGTQTRAVFCSVPAGAGVRVLSERLCKDVGDKPEQEQECESTESCDKWEVGDWEEPEKTCGITKMVREVNCVSPMENSTDGVMLSEGTCPEAEKPEREKEVFLEPCKGAEWATGEWSPCPACGSSIQTRSVQCILDDGHLYNETFCESKPKPETERPCEEAPPCEFRWFSSEWSPCSVSCGNGVRTRTVFCGKLEPNATCAELMPDDDDSCEGERPPNREDCENPQCDQHWLAAPWNRQCPENSCGGIPRRRAVFCYHGNEDTPTQDCEKSDTGGDDDGGGAKPAETDDCSPQACPTDQISELGGCSASEHGCCPDNQTAANSADFDGCPPLDRENITTPCDQTEWGCCRDLVTPAFGPFQAGCSLFALCNGTDFGCCDDDETKAATGPNKEGCEPEPCENTTFGCCPGEGETAAKDDEEGSNCSSDEDNEDISARLGLNDTDSLIEATSNATDETSEEIEGSGDGDGEGSGSDAVDLVALEPNCTEADFGCCDDGITPAKDAEKRIGCPHCRVSKFGCCPDGKTAALGMPGYKGCNDTCTDSEFGCCPDGFFAAKGENFEGCELEDCKESRFGCCSGTLSIPAKGDDGEGCSNCTESVFGCCLNGEDFALGPNGEGCCEDHEHACCPDQRTPAKGPDMAGCPCKSLPDGCCPDGVTPALGPDHFGCTCETSEFGCCPDGLTTALGPGQANCTCDRTAFGCCPDGVTPATGPDSHHSCQHCSTTQFGCCPDGQTPATGPSGRGCHCSTMKYGCCPDQRTPAAGPNERGCPCVAMQFGCCADGTTAARGPRLEGCEDCTKLRFGCCPDGVHGARGPDNEGCPCEATEFGCCPDARTPARGSAGEGCPEVACHLTRFGCCPDRTAAKGPLFEGCDLDEATRQRYLDHLRQRTPPPDHHQPDARRRPPPTAAYQPQRPPAPPMVRPPYYEPRRVREACFQSNDRGQCGNWTLVWFYDYKESRCARFYYGGCGGNDNRFPDEHSCRSLCDETFAAPPPAPPQVIPNWPGQVSPAQSPLQSQTFPFESRASVEPVAPPSSPPPAMPQRSPRYPCDLPKDVGPCKLHQERYWFNEETNSCERFVYGGCHGNTNNFPTRASCWNRCRVLTDAEKCTLPKALPSPDCSDPQPLFRFNYKLMVCEHYKGCTEDVNVFRDYDACVSTCAQGSFDSRLADDVCSLERDSGPCAEFTIAWHFDSSQGRCSQFYYGGCEGNANRFLSEGECHQFCGDKMPPSPPPPTAAAYLPPQGPTRSPPAPAPSQPTSGAMCGLPRDPGPCTTFEVRYFYDTQLQTCVPFHYGGCMGNQNNFVSVEDCQRHCSYSSPLGSGGGATGLSGRRINSFGTSEPAFNEADCLLAKERGTCSGQARMFYYNRADGVCREFTYSGCGGNANRFTTRTKCERSCKNAQDPCHLPTIKGRCGGSYKLWTYDSQRDVCKQFDYGGCSGNGNRFDSKADCEGRCVRRSLHINATSTDLPDKCHLRSDPGSCVHRMAKFYFDLRLGKCLPFHWGGCEGNDNRFETLNDCEKECLIPAIAAGLVNPNRENTLEQYEPALGSSFENTELCSLQSDPGTSNCHGAQPSYRYYFDSRSQRCLAFVYHGCDGNNNNFPTVEKCESACASSGGSSHVYGDHVRHTKLDTPRRPHPPSTWSGHQTPTAPAPIPKDEAQAVETGLCPPDNCGRFDCRGLGERREVSPTGCVRCRCNHPCDDVKCSRGEKCVVEVDMFRKYSGVCRLSTKAGQCPPVDPGYRQACNTTGDLRGPRRDQCRDDAGCIAAQKCCHDGCNWVCQDPVMTGTVPATTPSASTPAQEEDDDMEEVVVEGGETATLKCPILLDVTPRWTKQDADVEGDRFDQIDDTLKISMANKADAGVYQCADPDNGAKSAKIALRIAEPPTIVKDTPIVEATLNSTASLRCQVIGGHPRPAVVWSRGVTPLPARSSKYRQLPENTLQVMSVQPDDQDLYLCTASNDKGQAKFLVALIIPIVGDEEHQSRGQEFASKAKADAESIN